jgi:hypothetical protein
VTHVRDNLCTEKHIGDKMSSCYSHINETKKGMFCIIRNFAYICRNLKKDSYVPFLKFGKRPMFSGKDTEINVPLLP